MPESFKRYRFSVPNADESVTQWIEAQSNLSHSIRELIKMAIRCNGYSDVSCYPVRQVVTGGYPLEYLMLLQSQGWAAPPQAGAAPGANLGASTPETPGPLYPPAGTPAAGQVPPGYPAGFAPGFVPAVPGIAPQAPGPGPAPQAAPVSRPQAPAPQPAPPQQTFVSPEELLG